MTPFYVFQHFATWLRPYGEFTQIWGTVMRAAFSDAYARILKATGYAGQAELAQRIGVRQAVISDSRRRGEVRSEILLALLEQFNVSPQWVRTGEGERHFVTSVDKVASLYGMKLYSPRRTDGREQ